MSVSESEITAFLERGLALDATGRPSLDYLSICARATSRSWPQIARVEAHDRDPSDVVADVLEHVRDAGASAAAENRSRYAIRIHLYGPNGSPAGSRTFQSSYVSGSDDDADDGDGTPQGELVATVTQLRHLVRDQGATLERMAGRGYDLAFTALGAAQNLQQENAGLMVAIAEAEHAKAQAGSGMNKLMEKAAPMIPILLGVVMEKIATPDDPPVSDQLMTGQPDPAQIADQGSPSESQGSAE